jgi:NitT/TauT family transport system substrate-binding protein
MCYRGAREHHGGACSADEFRTTVCGNREGVFPSLADLKGRTVGVAGGIGSAGALFVVKASRGAGLPARDIEIVNLANADLPLALEKGAVDVGLLGSPFATIALKSS